MTDILKITLKAPTWDAPCQLCRRPLFFGDEGFVLSGVGVVCCSRTCAGHLVAPLARLRARREEAAHV